MVRLKLSRKNTSIKRETVVSSKSSEYKVKSKSSSRKSSLNERRGKITPTTTEIETVGGDKVGK